jgi:hypothetical protein
MKKAIALFLVSLCFSCQYFEKKVPNENELLEKQMKEINWNEVDEYPSVVDCEKLSIYSDFISESKGWLF